MAYTCDGSDSSKQETRNSKVLASFVTYCNAHPFERFWQALRNWSGQNFILTANSIRFSLTESVQYQDVEDSFYWEERYRNEHERV